jgi:hypothetical protein
VKERDRVERNMGVRESQFLEIKTEINLWQEQGEALDSPLIKVVAWLVGWCASGKKAVAIKVLLRSSQLRPFRSTSPPQNFIWQTRNIINLLLSALNLKRKNNLNLLPTQSLFQPQTL